MSQTSKSPTKSNKTSADLQNEDPVTGTPGSHPTGVGLGAALGGAAAGAAGGAIGGPVGAVVGAIVGGVAGGYGGKAVAEEVDPTVESAYWKNNYTKSKYYDDTYDYLSYEPAYQMGWETYDPKSSFEDRQEELRRRWESNKTKNQLPWVKAEGAARDAWNRVAEQSCSKNEACPTDKSSCK